MAQAGARGETAAQMDAVLHSAAGSGHANGISSLDQGLAGLSGTFKDMGNVDQPVTLRIANAPFAQQGLQLQGQFLDALASRYGAGLRLVDFQQDPTRACDLIYGWVSDQTQGRIPRLLDRVDPSTRLVLVNATYLKSAWRQGFDERFTSNAPFNRLDGSQVSVPTMETVLDEGLYAAGSGWQAVQLPYVDGSLVMTIVVPDDLAGFEASLDVTRFSLVTAALRPTWLDLRFPRFKTETMSDLSTVLAKMGMPVAFDPGRADFSGITTQERLYISKVVHQAEISVDEKGTEASAATAVEAAPTGVRPQLAWLKVDRPFIFAVRDANTGAILFLGRVVDPSA